MHCTPVSLRHCTITVCVWGLNQSCPSGLAASLMCCTTSATGLRRLSLNLRESVCGEHEISHDTKKNVPHPIRPSVRVVARQFEIFRLYNVPLQIGYCAIYGRNPYRRSVP